MIEDAQQRVRDEADEATVVIVRGHRGVYVAVTPAWESGRAAAVCEQTAPTSSFGWVRVHLGTDGVEVVYARLSAADPTGWQVETSSMADVPAALAPLSRARADIAGSSKGAGRLVKSAWYECDQGASGGTAAEFKSVPSVVELKRMGFSVATGEGQGCVGVTLANVPGPRGEQYPSVLRAALAQHALWGSHAGFLSADDAHRAIIACPGATPGLKTETRLVRAGFPVANAVGGSVEAQRLSALLAGAPSLLADGHGNLWAQVIGDGGYRGHWMTVDLSRMIFVDAQLGAAPLTVAGAAAIGVVGIAAWGGVTFTDRMVKRARAAEAAPTNEEPAAKRARQKKFLLKEQN